MEPHAREVGRQPLRNLLPGRCVSRRTVNAWNLPTHRTNVCAQLSAVMNGIKQCDPQQPANGISQNDFLILSRQPGWTIPTGVVELCDFLGKCVVMMLK